MHVAGGCGLASGLRFSVSSIVCPSALYVPYSVLSFKIVFEAKVPFHMHDFFNHPRNILLDLMFSGHTTESTGHQMHVASKDFRSYCSHHPIECSQPRFTKGRVALIESCFAATSPVKQGVFFLFFGGGW